MLDDEKYPIAVFPEGTSYQPEEKIASPVTGSDTLPPDYKTANMTTREAGHNFTDPKVDQSQTNGFAEAQLPERQSKRPWRKSPAILLLIALTFVIVGFGIAAAFYVHSRSVVSQTPNALSELSTDSIVQNNTRASMASSGLFLNDKSTWNMQTYWQTPTGDIKRQFSLDGQTFSAETNVSLQINPRIGSPLAATASTDKTGIVYLTLFYLSEQNEIVISGAACPAGSSTCSPTFNNVISSQLDLPPSNQTGLAAVNVNDAQDWRVYFHDIRGMLTEVGGNASGFGSGTVVGSAALNKSSIAATNVNSTTNNINVFYVDAKTQFLTTIEFVNGTWTIPGSVTPRKQLAWNALAGLSACYTKTLDQLHVYYTAGDQGIYEFLGTNVSTSKTTWGVRPGRNHVWSTADYPSADISAVGWQDQARFFQITQGKIIEGSLDNTTWTEAFIKLSQT
ncbi:hypothetical protein BP6252_06718 [Coleophoma cylindrospora]|uniref:Uncharacterized protein n=1 Tax=Coleophoma cylindrospora TaxID=1849047 RepID=A0A3D8RG20_9HELO|nr:hypothetical protein BP6252_06718 [Coleophoma cylindrospora]